LEKLIKYIVSIAAAFLLFYSLFTFNEYEELLAYFTRWNISHFYLLLLIIALIPLNWYLEAVKWQFVLRETEKIQLSMAFYSVFVGLTTAIISPGRIGEFAGRLLPLQPANRKKAGILWIISSLTMTIAILLFGIPAAGFYFRRDNSMSFLSGYSAVSYLYILIILVSCLLLGYFSLPLIRKFIIQKHTRYFSGMVDIFNMISYKGLIKILLFSMARFLVFCLQFNIMLRFFGIQLAFSEACIGIFTAYLIVTCLPSVFFTEAIVRSSVFVLVLSVFTTNTAGVAGTSMFLWILNVALPTFFGLILLNKKPSYSIKNRQ
jgi:hypothetical protein